MALRMNLYGWSLTSFKESLGSGNSTLLEAAGTLLGESLKEPTLSNAKPWLQRLIKNGHAFREEREEPSVPEDGGLLRVYMETEAHVFVVQSIARAISQNGYLDLASESSYWHHSAMSALHQELVASGFTRSKNCCVDYFSWMSKLSNGSPLFGDDFRTEWSFYSFLTNKELVAMLPVFRAAAEFTRPLPEGFPEEEKKKIRTTLSQDGKKFIGDLIGWFGRIQAAGQDALILWW